jgi:glutamate N-acetyltransferase / amino-acid N-acetyltransferase
MSSQLTANTQIRHYSAPGEGSIPSAKAKYVPSSGTYPQGFRAAAVHVGVKASNTKFDDLALIVSDVPASAAATFTTNRFQAAPVRVSKDVLKTRSGEGVRAVVVNSGCANAVTGKQGLQDAAKMGEETSKLVDEEYDADGKGGRAIVMSTGVIGQQYVSHHYNTLQTDRIDCPFVKY